MLSLLQKKKIKNYFANQPVELVYLFGSQASGKTKPLSDYDLAVLFQKGLSPKRRFNLRLDYIGALGGILKSDRVEILDLNSAPPTFRYSALAPRQEIYVKNEKKRVEFEHKTMSDYFDRLFYLNRHTLNSLTTIAKEGFSP
ncbi:MAG TPA: nucleotidyltransferase domain-containing protein [Nevskiaceae bacterium]|nr:nucleotidyltransferase domain-containing protein [Nevskiaceae bacterium]